jgi:S1-C subfamily serine protease
MRILAPGSHQEAPFVKENVARVRRSVVKVLTTSDAPDYDQPWQTQGSVSANGSGSIVSTKHGLRVLTNAHVVENQVFVECRRFGKSKKYVAEVEGVGHECDLALLRIDEPEFFEGAAPIEIGELPTLGDDVTVLGYPIGGDRISITQGVVSRIEMSHYAQSQRQLLAVQIDAAINAGNSGGPVIRDEKIVGVAFQALDDGQNIGYMIGAPVVRHFLVDMEDGTFDGFPDLGICTQTLESPILREYLGLAKRSKCGVLVGGVVYGGSAWKQLKRGDVLLSISGRNIAHDGSVRFGRGGRIDYSYIVSEHHVGDTATVGVRREGEELELRITLKPPRYLVAENRYDVKPTYYLFGGLLFVPLSRDFLRTWGEDWWESAPKDLISIYANEIPTAERSEVVILQKVLADKANVGFHDWGSRIITHVQEKRVKSLKHLVKMIEKCQGRFIKLDTGDGDTIVLDRELALKRGSTIHKRFGVPSDRSPDLM